MCFSLANRLSWSSRTSVKYSCYLVFRLCQAHEAMHVMNDRNSLQTGDLPPLRMRLRSSLRGAMLMCDKFKTCPEGRHFDRRSFLKVSAATATMGLLAGSLAEPQLMPRR